MLPGFLSTALEILIIVDICGAIVYVALSALIRSRNPKSGFEMPQFQPAYPNRLQPCPATGAPSDVYQASPLPTSQERPVYAGTDTPAAEEAATGFCAGLRHRISSLKGKFSYRPHAGTVERVSLDTEHKRLGQVLDSFKEET